jgi:hypothetical protein
MKFPNVGEDHWIGLGKLRCSVWFYHEAIGKSGNLNACSFLTWSQGAELDLPLSSARDQDGNYEPGPLIIYHAPSVKTSLLLLLSLSLSLSLSFIMYRVWDLYEGKNASLFCVGKEVLHLPL